MNWLADQAPSAERLAMTSAQHTYNDSGRINLSDAAMRPRGVLVPWGLFMGLIRKLLPPTVVFGSPCQRSKDEVVSFWHVPISLRRRLKIGPASLPNCKVYLDRLEHGKVIDKIQLRWGDACFAAETGDWASFVPRETLLVPICRRSESDEGLPNAYLADSRLLANKGLAYKLAPDRKKNRFRLRIKSQDIEQCSPHIYIIRVPEGSGNGHFVLEIEYEGERSQ